MTRCEDYPCCDHTDGLGCDWTYTPAARAYDEAHAFCEHEHGYCFLEEEEEDEYCCELALETGAVGPGFGHDEECDNYDGAPRYRPGMGPDDPVRCDND